MSDACEYPGCAEGWLLACAHRRWCWQHAAGHMGDEEGCRSDMGTAFMRLLRLVIWPGVKLREAILPARLQILDSMGRSHEHFYYEFKAAYEDAGAPLGDGEDAPLRWLEAQFESAAH